MKEVAVAIHAIQDFDPFIVKNLKGLNYIHVDVMDGNFVNNTNINLDSFRLLKEHYSIPIAAHLMVSDPLSYIKEIIDYVDIFLFHFEIDTDINEIIDRVKNYSKKVGIVANPETNISDITPFLSKINYVLIMTVNPGWSGQKFIPEMISKVNRLAEYKKNFSFKIIVDGGINLENAKDLQNVDIFSSSSTILKAIDPNDIIKKFKQL